MKIAIVSGSRADRGALLAVKEALIGAGVAVYWFDIHTPKGWEDRRVDVAYTTALACKWMGRDLDELVIGAFDLVIVHGDRYEVLGAATAGFLLGLPIAHLGGGDVTEGSQDDSIRHAITKLSHLHFATCKSSAKRLIQLGEQPDRVFNVGDPGTDELFHKNWLISKEETLKALGLTEVDRYFLVAYHPNTLGDAKAELTILVEALRQGREVMPDVGLILLGPNRDVGCLQIEREFKQLTGKAVKYYADLPRPTYLNALTHALALIGNSSAAFYEAPSTGTPVINVGNRQQGRLVSRNFLISAATTTEQILDTMLNVYKDRPTFSTPTPYGDGYACDKIVEILQKTDFKKLLQKSFYNV